MTKRSAAELFREIEAVLPEGGDWCTADKAHALAAMVLATRPAIVVEIGVWMGGSAIPIALALQHVGCGRLIAIDPWAPSASVVDQDDVNQAWWGKQDHQAAYAAFAARVEKHDLSQYVNISRRRSDEAQPPLRIDLAHIDGNHGPQAIRDVQRFAPFVALGGFMVLDDLNWSGGAVERAREIARELGFVELYPIGTGVVMQRRTA